MKVCVGMGGWPGWSLASSGWPQKPIQLIVPWPAGGGTDLSIRVLAEEAGQRLVAPGVCQWLADGYGVCLWRAGQCARDDVLPWIEHG